MFINPAIDNACVTQTMVRENAVDCKVDLSIVIYGVQASLRSGSSCLDKDIRCKVLSHALLVAFLLVGPTSCFKMSCTFVSGSGYA
jgi:hypothetical protein